MVLLIYYAYKTRREYDLEVGQYDEEKVFPTTINDYGPAVLKFNVKGYIIRVKLKGYLKRDMRLYVQNYKADSIDHYHTYALLHLKKGVVDEDFAMDAYLPYGRLIYLPDQSDSLSYDRHSPQSKQYLMINLATNWAKKKL